jgi:hypothetical protein
MSVQKYADVLAGVVTNIVLWDGVTAYTPPDGGTLVLCSGNPAAQAGGTYVGGVFTAPAAPPTPVPSSVTSAQLRLALTQQNLLATVNTAVAAASNEIQVYWEYQSTFNRQAPLLLGMAVVLGLTSAQCDAIFILAGTFPS